MPKTPKQFFIIALLLAYLAILLKLLVFRPSSPMAFDIADGNFLPLKTINDYLNDAPIRGIAIRNLVGNIVVFIPLGLFIPLLYRSCKWKTVLATGLVASVVLEIIQGISKIGVFDVDDILLNTLGAILGYGIYVCVKRLFRGRQTKGV